MKLAAYLKKVLSRLNAVPSHRWCVGRAGKDTPNSRCAFGHIIFTLRISEENQYRIDGAVREACSKGIVIINDYPVFPQKTPKARVIAAFRKAIKYHENA